MKDKFILDACCGNRQMWFDKKHPNVLYIDIRKEEKGFVKGRPDLNIQPDMIADFRNLPFADRSFKLIAWDPPHSMTFGKTSIMAAKYGRLNKETWKEDLSKGFCEIWRCLDDNGVLTLKWSNFEVSFKELLSLFPVKPLYGNISKNTKKSITQWFVFMKIPEVRDESN